MSSPARRALGSLVPFRRQIKDLDLTLRNLGNRLHGRAFSCDALSGLSDYNICINADMTVSCNCVDIDGSGHIGDLALHTLEEIFDGEVATRFRRSLARGVVPIRRCLSCRELVPRSSAEARRFLTEYTTPKRGIMVENTVLCNLACRHCSRAQILKIRKKPRLSLADMERVAVNIRDSGIRLVNFFNLGEPFLPDTILEEMTLMKKYNPGVPIYTSTNGLLLDREKRIEAALLMDYVYVSLDGATQESVARYQTGGDFERTYANARALIKARNARGVARPVVDWKYVVFSWNDSQAEIERAVALAREAGFDVISFWPGEGLAEHVSARFRQDPFFQILGAPSWKGREIDFRQEAARRASPPSRQEVIGSPEKGSQT